MNERKTRTRRGKRASCRRAQARVSRRENRPAAFGVVGAAVHRLPALGWAPRFLRSPCSARATSSFVLAMLARRRLRSTVRSPHFPMSPWSRSRRAGASSTGGPVTRSTLRSARARSLRRTSARSPTTTGPTTPEGCAQIRAADARFELRYPDEDSAVNSMLVVQDALERLTGGFGYDLEFNRITLAAEGEHRVLTEGPEQEAEDRELMSRIESMRDEELDRDLAEGGIDPARARRDGAEFIATMFKQREIYDALEAARAGAVDAKAREPRAALERKLAEVRAVPALGGAVGWFLKHHGVAKLADGELQAVVDELAKWSAARES